MKRSMQNANAQPMTNAMAMFACAMTAASTILISRTLSLTLGVLLTLALEIGRAHV